ncbi:MAG: tail fiber domain-containing protein, partial [Akkermansiaceae bacterium]|nr:tail fiber domain-containing protein [Akkermansiaceae bacterium]
LEVNKAPLESPTFTGTVSGITKSMVGLGNVDNTADADKPISDLTQAALDGKQAVGNYATLVDGMIPVNQLPLTLDNITAAPALPVIAFGRNDLGQTTVPSLANVAEIAARESHSLVLLKNGTVVTWGNGPSVPANLESVAAVSAGSSHDLVVKTNGTVLAWGDNTYGQTAVPSGITAATQAAAGEKHSLILLSTGAVMAWGNNSFGQTTVPTAASTNVIAIAAGYDHSLALKADGSVVAWGRNDADQTSVPVGLGNVIAIAAGAYHSLAVTSDGKVVAWGWNNGGQITVPADLSGVTKVTGGYAFSAALKSDGTLVAWGNNSYSQTTVPASATQVTHLAAGANHMLALRADLIPVEVARLDQDNVFTGRVGIGRTPTTNTLEVAGNASKSIAGSWLSNSDRRIKADVKSIAGGLETLDKVRLVDFRYTDDYLAAHPEIDDKRYPNVIAQEFAEVFPDHVKESGEFLPDGSPILQVDTYPLTIYSAVAVQELHRDSLELRKQNELLRQQLSDQEDRLDKLEELLKSR